LIKEIFNHIGNPLVNQSYTLPPSVPLSRLLLCSFACIFNLWTVWGKTGEGLVPLLCHQITRWTCMDVHGLSISNYFLCFPPV